jgi:hypothetical protein
LSQKTIDMAEKLGIIRVLASSLFRPRRFALLRAAGFFAFKWLAMHTIPWQIDDRTARLRTVGLAAELSLAQATHGLCHVVAGGSRWQAARLLGLTTTQPAAIKNERFHESVPTPIADGLPAGAGDVESAAGPIESHVRGDDLVLAYETSPSRSMHVDALWRVVTPEPGEKYMVAVDLIVSVRTQRADARPELAVQSTLPASEILRLGYAEPIHFRPLSPTPTATFAFGPDEGAGCLLFRQAGFPLSYAEMVHPADFCHDEWLPTAPKVEGSRLIHRLFRTALEKGVLLRGRVRGVFVPRVDDARLAAECYAAFAESEAPLGT